MTTVRKSVLSLALGLTVVLGVTSYAMAHGYGHGGGHRYEHSGYANGDYYGHNGRYGWTEDGRDMRARERRNSNSRDGMVDYVAPHKKNSNCEGMTGPHGRHID